MRNEKCDKRIYCDDYHFNHCDGCGANNPTVVDNCKDTKNELINLFNKYNILLVHINGKIVPVKNSTKQECYDLLYEIQELIEWRKILFNKHLNEVLDNGKEETT